jgi:hypothetical protein
MTSPTIVVSFRKRQFARQTGIGVASVYRKASGTAFSSVRKSTHVGRSSRLEPMALVDPKLSLVTLPRGASVC